jgi:hypothetical protein
VSLSIPAFTILPVTHVALRFGLALLVRIRGADGGMGVRSLASTPADADHDEHERSGHRNEENGGNGHRSNLPSD